MNWYDEMLEWLESPEPASPAGIARQWRATSERVARKALVKRGRLATPEALDAEIARWLTAQQQAAMAAGRRYSLTPEEKAAAASIQRHERPPELGSREPPWHRGASSDEIAAFRLSQCTCGTCPPEADNRPDGGSIPLKTTDELHRQLVVAQQRLAERRTRWLERYTGQLLDELRRRNGCRTP